MCELGAEVVAGVEKDVCLNRGLSKTLQRESMQ
jgi:hypothetical protein